MAGNLITGNLVEPELTLDEASQNKSAALKARKSAESACGIAGGKALKNKGSTMEYADSKPTKQVRWKKEISVMFQTKQVLCSKRNKTNMTLNR
jgi:hypothetical protein